MALDSRINIKRILCPTDLSPHSGSAVRYALALASAHEAELVLLYCEPGLSAASGEENSGIHRAELLKATLFEQLEPSDLAGLRWRFVVAHTDDIGEEITLQAQTEAVDLIVKSCGVTEKFGCRYGPACENFRTVA